VNEEEEVFDAAEELAVEDVVAAEPLLLHAASSNPSAPSRSTAPTRGSR
jgi:hypothetical protein